MPGKIRVITSAMLKGPEFPVVTSTGTVVYQVRDGKGWRTVCSLGAEKVGTIVAHLTSRKRKMGTHYRFAVSK